MARAIDDPIKLEIWLEPFCKECPGAELMVDSHRTFNGNKPYYILRCSRMEVCRVIAKNMSEKGAESL